MSTPKLTEQVDLIAKLADLREVDYHNTLILHSIIELLIQKGLLTHSELQATAQRLDKQLDNQLTSLPLT